MRDARSWTALVASLPGLLFGAHLTGLLYFLNPALDISTGPALRGVVLYGGVFGLIGALVQLSWISRRPERVHRGFPWLLTLVFAFVAGLLAGNASVYSYFLPPGVNLRLLKAAVILGLAALITFYTALLHSLARRPYGRRSRIGIAVLALGSLYVMVERREAYRPDPRPTLASSVEDPKPMSLIVVGLDGASLDVVLPLAQQGQLPFFADCLAQGSYARLRSLQPLRRDAAWTTVATGKWPYKHGVVGHHRYQLPPFGPDRELSLLPAGMAFPYWGLSRGSLRVVERQDRSALAAWEITDRLGLPSGVVGWPLSSPPSGGSFSFVVDERFFDDATAENVSPPDLLDTATLYLQGAGGVDPDLLSPYPEPAHARIRSALRRDLESVELFRTLAGESPATRTLFLRLPGLATASELFFGGVADHPLEAASLSGAAPAARSLGNYYRWIDRQLTSLWTEVQPPAILVMVSAHGYDSLDWWSHRGRPALEARGVASGKSDGLLVVRGPTVRAGSYVADAGIEDVLPTLLYGLGLPVARDLDGHVLTDFFEPQRLTERPLAFLPSYETLVRDRLHPLPPRPDPGAGE